MRESFGGAFMLKIALIFIIIYISFMAVAINYAKAFRVKNQVINIVEQHQYSEQNSALIVKEYIDPYLKNVGYSYGGEAALREHCNSYENSSGLKNVFTSYGACIVPEGGSTKSNVGRYYKVITYIYIELPFFDINMTVPISGETKIIHS